MQRNKTAETVQTVATMVARNANEAVVRSGGICVWQESGFIRREDVITFALLHNNML
jgi:hypothetical protein